MDNSRPTMNSTITPEEKGTEYSVSQYSEQPVQVCSMCTRVINGCGDWRGREGRVRRERQLSLAILLIQKFYTLLKYTEDSPHLAHYSYVANDSDLLYLINLHTRYLHRVLGLAFNLFFFSGVPSRKMTVTIMYIGVGPSDLALQTHPVFKVHTPSSAEYRLITNSPRYSSAEPLDSPPSFCLLKISQKRGHPVRMRPSHEL